MRRPRAAAQPARRDTRSSASQSRRRAALAPRSTAGEQAVGAVLVISGMAGAVIWFVLVNQPRLHALAVAVRSAL
jgi:hypothetical protein